MRIGLDFDGTYDQDAAFWDAFIALAKEHGHSVWLVTCRRDTPENREIVKAPCPVIFTGLAAKDWHCAQRGLVIDVWVEDDVACVLRGK